MPTAFENVHEPDDITVNIGVRVGQGIPHSSLGCEVDAWETTYLHVLEGEDAVFEWISGTGARPTLQALPAGLREEFAGELRRRLRAAYPPRDGRVVLPFRRAFAVARVPA